VVGADHDYISKATQAIKNTMLGSPAEQAIKTIEYLNASNAILSKSNAQLVASTRARQQAKKGKKAISKARLLSKHDADQLRADIEAKKAADVAHKAATKHKKEEQALKKTQEEAEKAERATQRAVAKNMRDTHTEFVRMAKSHQSLFI
jgi:pyruvate/2-oxoglutarate dehydrogenase complex dihydrolipoamide acyltransferase (E2) component